jgi:hypothetical protein
MSSATNDVRPPGRLPIGKSVASMVLGILGLLLYIVFFVGLLLALPALVLGFLALRGCKAGVAGGRDMAIVGIVTSQITIVLAVLSGLALLAGGGS